LSGFPPLRDSRFKVDDPKQRPPKDSGRVILTFPGVEEKND
jgi:hypothetical protein